jgi:hypothetical protein
MNTLEFRRKTKGELRLDDKFFRRDRNKDQPAKEINYGRVANMIISHVGCIF